MPLPDVNAYRLALVTYEDVGVLGLEEYYFKDVREALVKLKELGCPSVIVQTCNRVEVYSYGCEPARALASAGVNAGFTSRARGLRGVDVVRHLMRLVCGLESLALGEHQVAGQVRRFYSMSRELGCASSELQHLFDEALKVCKKVRSLFPSLQVPDYFSLTVSILDKHLGSGTVLILGTGDAAKELVSRIAAKRKTYTMIVVGRSRTKAADVAGRYGARWALLSDLESVIGEADAVVSAVSAPGHVLTREMVARSGRRIKVVVDLGVPPNVDPGVAKLGVALYTMEDLSRLIEERRERLKDYAERASKMVEEEVLRFAAKLRLRRLEAAISEVYRRAEEIRRRELEEAIAKLAPYVKSEERVREILASFSRSLVKKLYHDHVSSLRKLVLSGELGDEEVESVVKILFGGVLRDRDQA